MSAIFSFSLRSAKRFDGRGPGARGRGSGKGGSLCSRFVSRIASAASFHSPTPGPRRPTPRLPASAGLLLITCALCVSAAGVDRVAVVVGDKVITESEVLDDLRLTEFLNQQPLDLSPARRREAAEKMVDQQLIRNEMDTARYQQPDTEKADAMLANFRGEHLRSDSAWRAALAKYGLNEAQVKQRLLWQFSVIQFTDARFQPEVALPPPPNVQTANRMRAGVTPPPAGQTGQTVDQLLDQWLKQQRSSTRVVFKQEAFQ